MKFFSRARLALAASAALLICAPIFLRSQAQDVPAYRNPKLPIEARLADLLSRMTLEEKVAQMEGVWENPAFMKTPESRFVDDKGAFLPDHAAVSVEGRYRPNVASERSLPRSARRGGVHQHDAKVDEGEHAAWHSRDVS